MTDLDNSAKGISDRVGDFLAEKLVEFVRSEHRTGWVPAKEASYPSTWIERLRHGLGRHVYYGRATCLICGKWVND
jgi:hypothetical protein